MLIYEGVSNGENYLGNRSYKKMDFGMKSWGGMSGLNSLPNANVPLWIGIGRTGKWGYIFPSGVIIVAVTVCTSCLRK
jgi:hypothetical protein